MTRPAAYVVLCLSVVAMGGGAATSGGAGGAGVLVFSARPHARGAYGWQLLVGDLDSGRVSRLRRVDGTVSPSWSPDGSEVAYERADTSGPCNSPACSQIWLVNANGRHPRRLTSMRRRSESPDWASTGRIAFVRLFPTETEIYSLESNGHDLRRLTHTRGEDDDPAWSGDGQHIAFSSDRAGNFEIYVMNADGGDLRRVTTSRGADEYGPAWSPDGTRIAFWRRKDDGDSIVVINSDGTNEHTISGRRRDTEFPAWSPDGESIAYVRDDESLDMAHIWVMRSDGSEKHKLIDGPFSEPMELDWTQAAMRLEAAALESRRSRQAKKVGLRPW